MDISALLRGRFPRLCIEENFSFAAHTTIGCGGTAAVAAYPASQEEACGAIAFLRGCGIPYFVLGLGANVLPSEGRFEGAVVRLTKLSGLCLRDGTVSAGAGATGAALIAFARARAIGGFEPFFGIPMTLGGAAAMNAGVAELHISDVLLGATGIENGKLRRFSAADCNFSEKDSIFLQGIAVTEVTLRAEAGDPAEIERRLGAYAVRRRALPKGRSMGCTFVNPPGASAGALIDACGLKGVRRGGAYVSDVHANFIINEGGSAEDVAALIDYVRAAVLEKTGVALREEIRRLKF